MGYSARVFVNNFRIKEENKRSALKAIREKVKETFHSQKKFFRCTDDAALLHAGILEDVLEEIGWLPVTDPETGDIVNLSMTCDKLGDEDQLFSVIAPFVEVGAFIEFHGSHDEKWRLVFDGNTVSLKKPKVIVIWED